MAFDDTLRNGVSAATGAAKEKVGKLTDNPKLEAEGSVQHDKAKLAEAADKVKRGVQGAADDIKDVLEK